MKNSEILKEINCTLDQLIKNAAALAEIFEDPLFKSEVQALNKTQESLLSHLVHLDQFLKEKQNSSPAINQKLDLFSQLTDQVYKKKNRSSLKKKMKNGDRIVQ